MSSRGKWEDMVKGVLDVVAPVSKPKKETKQEPKKEDRKMSIEDVPGDPGSTIGMLRKHKQDLAEAD